MAPFFRVFLLMLLLGILINQTTLVHAPVNTGANAEVRALTAFSVMLVRLFTQVIQFAAGPLASAVLLIMMLLMMVVKLFLGN